jgi:RNA polymerase sigma factor (TIGR02999 family)
MDRKHKQNGDVTELLVQFRCGNRSAEATLIPLVYNELHRIAARHMRRERPDHSLQPTALVNEAYVRLISERAKSWKNRAHFFAFASGLMREILVDHARRRGAAKRGDGKPHVRLDDPRVSPSAEPVLNDRLESLIAIDEALTELAAIDSRQSRIVELRFFAGMSSKEIAEILEISERTVDREWAVAQAWLYARLRSIA